MKRAPLLISVAGLFGLTLGGIAGAAPVKTTKTSTSSVTKTKTVVCKTTTTRKSTPVAKGPRVQSTPARENNFMVLQIEGDEIIPSSKTALIRITKVKRPAKA